MGFVNMGFNSVDLGVWCCYVLLALYVVACGCVVWLMRLVV